MNKTKNLATFAAIGAALFVSGAKADYSSTWILQRVIVTGDYHKPFDTALDASIQVGGVLKIVNDSYELKGKLCDTRISECVKIKENLKILALDEEGLWADAEDHYGEAQTVHIINREEDSTDALNLLFTEGESTIVQSFKLVDHAEALPLFQFENGVGMLEGRMMIEQISRNHGY